MTEPAIRPPAAPPALPPWAPPRCDGCGQAEPLRDRSGRRQRLRHYGRAAEEGTVTGTLCTMCSATVFFARDNPDVLRSLTDLLQQAGPAGGPHREARLRDLRDEPLLPPADAVMERALPLADQARARLSRPSGMALPTYVREVQIAEMCWALDAGNGSQRQAATLLHINRTTLTNMIKRFGLVKRCGRYARP